MIGIHARLDHRYHFGTMFGLVDDGATYICASAHTVNKEHHILADRPELCDLPLLSACQQVRIDTLHHGEQ